MNNIYDSPKNSNAKPYPKLVSASSDIGYRVVAPKSLWNENTEQNIRAMLNRRANKRMQEIAEDFDVAMYPHSSKKRGKYSESGLTPNLLRKQDMANSHSHRRRVDSEMGQSANTRRKESILAHSGAQSLTGPNINVKSHQQHMWAKQRELFDSDDEADHHGATGAYRSIAKATPNVINEQSEGGTSQPCNRTMSNFSAQYKNFKQQKQGKSLERRNINVGKKKEFMNDGLYFKGEETDENLNVTTLSGTIGMHEMAQRSMNTGRVQSTINKDIRNVQTPNMIVQSGAETLSVDINESARAAANQSVGYYKSSGGIMGPAPQGNSSMTYGANDKLFKNQMVTYSPHTNIMGSYASTKSSVHQHHVPTKQHSQPPSVFANPTLVQTAMRP